MYFNLIYRNSKKNYKENGIYFFTLLIAIISFYILLSLNQQDVIVFLRKMESDALNKLFMLIRAVYIVSLFLLFFLIYFAQRYQLERRSHEIGLLLMLGSKRGSLFSMLMLEDVITSGISLLIGLPVAVMLSELVGLITARLIGLGIIGHRFSFSLSAVLLTALGFLVIKFFANFLLSARLMQREPAALMQEETEKKQKKRSVRSGSAWLIVGVISLLVAYWIGISGNLFRNLFLLLLLLVSGSFGTYSVFRGLLSFLVRRAGRKTNKDVLAVFTFRQLQENVMSRLSSLTVSSLLMLVATVCLAYGVAVSVTEMQNNSHTLDFTMEIWDDESKEQIETFSKREDVSEYISRWIPVSVSYMVLSDDPYRAAGEGNTENKKVVDFDCSDVEQKIQSLGEEDYEAFRYSSAGSCLLPDDVGGVYSPHVMPIRCINELRENSGKKPYQLKENEVIFYMDSEFSGTETEQLYQRLLALHPTLKINGKEYTVRMEICSEDIVVDRSITIGFGLVLPDSDYDSYKDVSNESIYYNACIKQEFIEKLGLLGAITEVDKLFASSGMEYENYLQNMGRQIFYIVAASYLTIYMAVLFFLIANTVVSLQFLMQQRNMVKRYRTLLCLGSDYGMLHASTRRQIRYFFGIPVIMALISGVFGIMTLIGNMLPGSLRGKIVMLFFIAFAVIILYGVIEVIYMSLVSHLTRKNMHDMLKIRRIE